MDVVKVGSNFFRIKRFRYGIQIQRGERIPGFIFRNGVTGKAKAGRVKLYACFP